MMKIGKAVTTMNHYKDRQKQITVAAVAGTGVSGVQKLPYFKPSQVAMISSRQHSKKSRMK